MLKSYKKFYSLCFVCVFALLALNGCTKSEKSFINTSNLGSMVYTDRNDAQDNHEMVKLNNGVVIYKDKTNNPSPSGYTGVNFSPAKPIYFGPPDIRFSPKKVNPK